MRFTLILRLPVSVSVLRFSLVRWVPVRAFSGGNNNLFPCNSCDRSFQTRQSLKQHQVAKHGPTHKCGFCDRSYITRRGLEDHMNDKHPAQSKCPACANTRFRSLQGAMQHLESGACPNCRGKKHARGQVYNCISPHIGGSLLLGASSSGEVPDFPYECPQCPRSFRELNHLMQHQKDKHGDSGQLGGSNFLRLGSG